MQSNTTLSIKMFNPLNAELNPICHLLALLGAHHIFHVSGLRVNDYTRQLHVSVLTGHLQVVFKRT